MKTAKEQRKVSAQKDPAKKKKQNENAAPVNGQGKIKNKITLAFFIPIILIVLLGTVCYQTAANGLRAESETATEDTVSAMGEYMALLCGTVETRAVEILSNENLSKYYLKYYKTADTESMRYFKDAKNALVTMKGTCNYLDSFYVFAENGNPITSTSFVIPDTAYADYMATEEAGIWADMPKNKGIWNGYHSFLDSEIGVNTDNYGIHYTRQFPKGNALIVLDVKKKTIEDLLDGIDCGEDGYAALVTPDGREVKNTAAAQDAVFAGSEFIESAWQAETTGHAYVKYQGKKCLFTYTPIGNTGMLICTLIPQSTLLSRVAMIRNITIVIVILACVIAFIIGNMLANGISREVKNTVQGLQKVAEGDLTVAFASGRNDEFKTLSNSVGITLMSIRKILADMRIFGERVAQAADNLTGTADDLVESMSNINGAVEEVGHGVAEQASDTEQVLKMVSDFSQIMNRVNQNTIKMQQSAQAAIQTSTKGETFVAELNEKSAQTVHITNVLAENISDVQTRSEDIGSIVDTINAIAEQTNLLSLNASIEAARAGEHGRGFAVVAEEIRKLADQSMQAGNRIKEIVDNIQNTTAVTTQSAKEAETLMHNQVDNIESTVAVFGEIKTAVDILVEGLSDVVRQVESMMSDTDRILSSIENISAVSEEAAASTQEVTATVTNQLDEVRKLAEEIDTLSKQAGELERSMQKFNL